MPIYGIGNADLEPRKVNADPQNWYCRTTGGDHGETTGEIQAVTTEGPNFDGGCNFDGKIHLFARNFDGPPNYLKELKVNFFKYIF